jgi:hypothetical protein
MQSKVKSRKINLNLIVTVLETKLKDRRKKKSLLNWKCQIYFTHTKI